VFAIPLSSDIVQESKLMNQRFRASRAGGAQATGATFRHAMGLTLGLACSTAWSAEIHGHVVDPTGAPLARAPVCLRAPPTASKCTKVRFSDRHGEYSFRGLKAGTEVAVEIFLDRSASARKFEQYATYVWSPRAQTASIVSKNDRVRVDRFTGKFNFSNFQRVVELSGTDFPELLQLDSTLQPVFLKVFYMAPSAADGIPETLYLGQVTDPARLRLEASVPVAVTAIDYEIYSATFSRSGRIVLAD
jgi:hypothetical protein